MNVAISPVFETLIAKLSFRTAIRNGELYIIDAPTELRFRVSEQAGNFSLDISWRGGAWQPIMHAEQVYYFEVAIMNALILDLRLENNLPRLVIPYEWNSAAVGFEPQLLEDGWTTLLHNGSPMPFRMDGYEIIGPVVRYSYLVGFSISELIAAAESPDGGVVASRITSKFSTRKGILR